MSSPDLSTAAKEASAVFAPTHSISWIFSALWLGVISTARQAFQREPLPPVDSKPNLSQSRGADVPGVTARVPIALPTGTRSPAPEFISNYAHTLETVWREHDWSDVALLVETLRRCWRENRQVFICGNGGSAANAIHLANDFLYGIAKPAGDGLRVIALPANPAVLTCLANDVGYEDIFAQQLTVLAQPGDVLLAFSGSGNSPNILKALTRARELGVTSFAILGFSGGRALALADHPIYFPVDDMQVSEDLQMMVGHMAMQSLSRSGR